MLLATQKTITCMYEEKLLRLFNAKRLFYFSKKFVSIWLGKELPCQQDPMIKYFLSDPDSILIEPTYEFHQARGDL